MQKLKNIFLLFAFGMVLTHSIVPHHHSEELKLCVEAESQKDITLLNLLEQAFHLDFGDDNHLENFSGTVFSFDLHSFTASHTSLIELILPCKSVSYLNPNSVFTLHPTHFKCETYRGPPHTV